MDALTMEDLNFLLKGELSAVDAYTEAIKRIENEQAKPVLEECLSSHLNRSEKLREAILDGGGIPNADTGAWGGFVKFVTDSIGASGDKAMIVALEEGEDIGSNDYDWRLVKMHQSPYRKLVKEELRPEQERTHQKLISLVH